MAAPVFRHWETLYVDLVRQRSLGSQNLIGKVEHLADVRFDPLFDKGSLSWFETVTFRIKSNANVFQDVQRSKALGGSIASKLYNVLYRGLPARVCGVQGQIRKRHAEPLSHLFRKPSWIKQTKYLVTELDNETIFGRHLWIEILVKLLVYNLRPNKMLHLARLLLL